MNVLNTFGRKPGRHLLHIPGPTPVPERILRAMDLPVIDHRGPEFQRLGRRVLEGMKSVFQTEMPVVIFPSSGTGAWEAALANTLSSGDRVLMYETGHFATVWRAMAVKLGLKVEFLPSDWRTGADPDRIEAALRADADRSLKAVCVVHNETSTGCTSRIDDVRKAIDAAGHPALLLVDTISSLGSIDYRHDEWGVDVSVGGSQKGLMLPPGLSFNAVSEKALAASKKATLPRSYFDWQDMLQNGKSGFFPYTPATTLLYGLDEALIMLHEEGLQNVFRRHDRLAAATRRAVSGWELEILCRDPACYSSSLTAVLLPEACDADAFRAVALAHFDLSLGKGLAKLEGRVFRIGHLGDVNDAGVIAALAVIEMTLELARIPHRKGGVLKAMDYLVEATKEAALA
jgi:alanine-glyoxylate transaminase/serine-glyoxylate transaminase/serine-pyruvate transaminase